jgi:peptide/nickel transport system substrate-binding protein
MFSRMSGRQRLILRPVLSLLTVLALTAVACSPAADTGGNGGSGGDGGGEVQNPSMLVVTTDDEPENLDPAAIEDNGLGRAAIMYGYDRLLQILAGSNELSPMVATEVPTVENGGISKDGRTYTFPLRDDVTFHDGGNLTAEAVRYSWDRVMTMNLPEGQSEAFENIARMRAVDDHTFEVTLKEVDASFLYGVVASMPASIVNPEVVEANGGVVKNKPNEFMAQNMAGSGVYRFVDWQRGERLSFEINEDYWGEPAKLDLQWNNVQDRNVATLGLRAGDYDIIEGVPDLISDVEGAPGVVVDTDTPGLQLLQIGFNLKYNVEDLPRGDDIPADFFHDVRVRQAFSHAFNYQAMIDGPLSGAATRGSFILPQGMFGYDENAPIYEYDLERAEELFRETGWIDRGFTVSVIAEEDSGFEAQALILKDGIESISPNMRITVLALPEARFDEMMASQPIPAALWSWTTPEFRDPHAYFMDSVHSEGRWGQLAGIAEGFSNPDELDRMIEKAQQELEPTAREELYSGLQASVYEEAPSIFPAQEAAVLAHRDWLTDVVANPMWPRPALNYALYGKATN